ncbi:RapZ C-terminal domain-containing protein [Streptomyces boncukensis]|uniref:ATPase n=1 Tax=Streptomyces boncukensis TaxID=2711219 RepID=A0A6G4WS60_9ACTN|nr:RNase adapter RapZ [Streptomyces boncukensis]NGO67467.1 ATPase [Streptomyces boncukensis]
MSRQPGADVGVSSFGYLHGGPPPAHLTLDLRDHFRDPHVRPELRELTAHDATVRRAVLDTAGIGELIDAAVAAALAFRSGPGHSELLRLTAGCAGGRHRAPTFAMALADRLTASGLAVQVRHRDLHRPVVQR